MFSASRFCCTRVALVIPSILYVSSDALASEIIPESRDSAVTVTPTNLGPYPGYVGGGDGEIDVQLTGLSSADDYLGLGFYYYGPDGFDRINTGNYTAIHDATIEPDRVGFYFQVSALAEGEASPQVISQTDSVLYFSVSEDVTATLSMSYDGNTNIGNDTVGLDVRRVGPGDNPQVLETLFTTAVYPAGEGSDEVEIELLAGERYQIAMDASARSLDGIGSIESVLSMTSSCPDARRISTATGRWTSSMSAHSSSPTTRWTRSLISTAMATTTSSMSPPSSSPTTPAVRDPS